jgi:hypothetical protein
VRDFSVWICSGQHTKQKYDYWKFNVISSQRMILNQYPFNLHLPNLQDKMLTSIFLPAEIQQRTKRASQIISPLPL